MKKIIAILFLLVLSACSRGLSEKEINELVNELVEERVNEIIKQNENEVTSLSSQLADVVEESIGSVYLIQAIDRTGSSRGSGSGAIFHEDDEYYYGFTNFHVVDNGLTYKVFFNPDKGYDALLVGISPENDLAVIKIKKEPSLPSFKVLKFGDYSKTRVGELVLSIGSPSGPEHFNTTTIGVVSGVDRMQNVYDMDKDGVKETSTKMIQHDSAINGGNSGGPLFNIKGELIGVNTLKIISNNSENLGFAVAGDYAERVLFSIVENGEFTTVRLGIFGTVYAVEVDDDSIKGGVLIKEIIEEGSVATSNSDVKVDDILIELNGKEIFNMLDVRNALFTIKEGETVEMKLYRSGTIITTSVTLK